MAEKVSTLVVTLNHGCCRCFTKIRKIVCKLQETEDIRAISYYEVSGTVTISGAFDPLVLPCKLRRMAGCLLRDIQLVAAELRLTPQRPPRPVQRPAMLLPNPSGGLALAAFAPSSCCCGICGCGGYGGYGGCYCGCQACAFVNLNHPPGCYRELPLRLRSGVVRCVQDHVMFFFLVTVFATRFTLLVFRVVELVLNWNGGSNVEG